MCFYYTSDWSADIFTQTDSRSGEATTCCECGRQIAETDWRRSIYLQQHEGCIDCDGPNDGTLCTALVAAGLDGPCDFGEKWSGDICRGCTAFLAAIRRVEREAGCPLDAQQPPIGGLWEEMRNHYDGVKYCERAVQMFTSLIDHPIVRDVVDRDGLDLQPCHTCGAPLFTIPDGMPAFCHRHVPLTV